MDSDLLERLDRFALGRSDQDVGDRGRLEAHLESNDTALDLPFLAVGRSDHGRFRSTAEAIVRGGRQRPAERPVPKGAEAWRSFSTRARFWPRPISRISTIGPRWVVSPGRRAAQ